MTYLIIFFFKNTTVKVQYKTSAVYLVGLVSPTVNEYS